MSRSVLITGAAGGIGKALCAEFYKAGYRVVATDIIRNDDIQGCNFIQYDLGNICHSCSNLVDFAGLVRKALPFGQLDVLINNAAIQIIAPTREIETRDWLKTLDVNLSVPFLLAKEFLPELESTSGSIINIASVHAQATKPGFVAYATSKAGLVGLTQALAVDLGGKIRVNAINPGATRTEMLLEGFEGKMDLYKKLEEMHPIGRIANPEEIAKLALFLASEKSGFITGAAINVDGGILSRLHDPD